MDLSKISVRYAKAVYLLSVEKGLLDQVKNDIVFIWDIIRANQDFKNVIESPVIKPSQKIKAVNAILKGSILDLTLNFMNILIKNKREQNLDGICRRFLDIYAKEKGIKTALITTAVSLDDAVSRRISEILAQEFKAKIVIELQQKPEILGGYILKVDDQQYDASVASSLRKIKQSLLKSDYSKN